MTASNVETLGSLHQTRQDYQYSATVDGLLKNVYLPALNNTTFHATPLMEMFGDFGGKIDFAANKIIKAFKYQGAGGFGGIAEGGDWVKGRNQKGFQGEERLKYLNAFVSLTGPAARTVKEGQGGYVDAISSAMSDTLDLAKMQMERIIGGDSTGELCRFLVSAHAEVADGEYWSATGGDAGTTETQITATAGGAYTKCQWLQPGMRVSLVTAAAFDAPPLVAAELVGVGEIGQVDYDDGTFALKNVSGSALDLTDTTYVLCLENAYGQIEAAGGPHATEYDCLELNGLYGLVSATGAIWGIADRTTYPRSLKSKVVAAASAELDEELMMGWVLDMANIRHNVPNVCVVDPLSRQKYFSNRKEDRRFDMPVIDTPFGFRSTGVVIDNYTLMLQSLASLKPGSLFLLNVGDFKFAKATDGFQWVTDGPMGAFRQREGSDNLYATAVNYCNFVCENPMGQMKVTGLAT